MGVEHPFEQSNNLKGEAGKQKKRQKRPGKI